MAGDQEEVVPAPMLGGPQDGGEAAGGEVGRQTAAALLHVSRPGQVGERRDTGPDPGIEVERRAVLAGVEEKILKLGGDEEGHGCHLAEAGPEQCAETMVE